MNLLVFGSEDFSFDNGAVRLIGCLQRRLPGWNIQRMARPEQLLNFLDKQFIILDVAAGIDSPLLITDPGMIKYGCKVTAHDMDLAAFLRILKEVGQIDKVAIVAVPNHKDPNEFKEEVVNLIQNVPVSAWKDS